MSENRAQTTIATPHVWPTFRALDARALITFHRWSFGTYAGHPRASK